MICLSWLGWVWKECRCKVKSMNEPLMLHSKKVNQIPSNHALHKSRRKSWRLDLEVQDVCLGLMLCFLQLIRRSGLPSGYPPCFDDEAATHSSSLSSQLGSSKSCQLLWSWLDGTKLSLAKKVVEVELQHRASLWWGGAHRRAETHWKHPTIQLFGSTSAWIVQPIEDHSSHHDVIWDQTDQEGGLLSHVRHRFGSTPASPDDAPIPGQSPKVWSVEWPPNLLQTASSSPWLFGLAWVVGEEVPSD